MGMHITRCAEETVRLGEELAARLRGGEVIAFTGGLGVGKTTFCRGIARGLQSADIVSSPTYAIVNVYRGKKTFAHFDAWRIQGPEDLEAAGFYDFLDAGAVLAVEWSEKVAAYLEGPVVRVNIRTLEPEVREIQIEGAVEF